MKILITGSEGFIGKNLINFIKDNYHYELLQFKNGEKLKELDEKIKKTDFIIHLAAANRPKDKKLFKEVNIDLTLYISEYLKKNELRMPIIFTSSVQANLSNDYGKSKLKAENILSDLNRTNHNKIIIYRLPGVFGKWCKPNYNSVVSTFCYNAANNLELKISEPKKEISLVYVEDVVKDICKLIKGNKKNIIYREVKPLYKIKLRDLANKILSFKKSRKDLLIPNVGKGLNKKLYSTYISFLKKNDFSYPLKEYVDERGKFVEVLKNNNSGQIAYFTAHPGNTRGGHYHNTKSEKFVVIHGKAKFIFKNLKSGEKFETFADSKNLKVVDSIPGWIHNITNVGDQELKVILWSSEIFDKSNPDTYQKEI